MCVGGGGVYNEINDNERKQLPVSLNLQHLDLAILFFSANIARIVTPKCVLQYIIFET